jgi:hypothetical protein
MIDKTTQAVALVIRMIEALEASKAKLDGVAFDPVTFFQHEALSGWLPQAKSLIQHIEGSSDDTR